MKSYDHTPLVRSVYDRLVRELSSGRYAPNLRLPTHREWAQRFGVSTITVFRAMDVMKAKGFIDSSKGAATILRAVPPPDLLRGSELRTVKPVCLTSWVWDRKDLVKTRAAIVRQRFQSAFRREHSQIEFHEKQVELPSDEFQAVLIRNVVGGAEPTFAATTRTCLRFLNEHGALASMSELARSHADLCAYLGELNPELLEAGSGSRGTDASGDDGHAVGRHFLLMLPTHVSHSFLFYNKALFRKAGLNPAQPPRDWEQFQGCARRLSEAMGGKPSFHLMGSRGLVWWLEQLVYESVEPSWQGTLPEIDWLSRPAARAVEWFIDCHFKQGLVRVHTGDLSHFLPAWLADEIPMTMGDGGFAAQVGALGDAERLGIAPMPAGPNGRRISQKNCAGFFINAHATPPEQEAALRYLCAWEQWVHLGEGGGQLRQLGVAPAMFSPLRDPARDRFVARDMPSDWRAALFQIEAQGVWERDGADWARMTAGSALADMLRSGEPPSPERIQQVLRLNQQASGFSVG